MPTVAARNCNDGGGVNPPVPAPPENPSVDIACPPEVNVGSIAKFNVSAVTPNLGFGITGGAIAFLKDGVVVKVIAFSGANACIETSFTEPGSYQAIATASDGLSLTSDPDTCDFIVTDVYLARSFQSKLSLGATLIG